MGTHGRFVWYELMTRDESASIAFYTEVIGWRVQGWDGSGDGGSSGAPYKMLTVGERPIGGLMKLPAEAEAMGAPPHWLAYVQVDDIDATTAKIAELGGKVLQGPMAVPEVGRMTVFSDPTGAVLAAIQLESDMPAREGDAEQGDISWNELNTTDWEKARDFYCALFGWQEHSRMPMPEEMGSTYWMFMGAEGGEFPRGGMCNAASAMQAPAHWLSYFHVTDLDAALERARSHGGQVNMGPMEIPGGDRIAVCGDPQGITFALHGK